MRNLVRFRRHSGHGWTCRWVAPVANDPERTCIHALMPRQPSVRHSNTSLTFWGTLLPGGYMERRLAAILVADVAGYSRLMEADEEGTLRRLRATLHDLFEPKIGEHHGRLVKTTGDGL